VRPGQPDAPAPDRRCGAESAQSATICNDLQRRRPVPISWRAQRSDPAAGARAWIASSPYGAPRNDGGAVNRQRSASTCTGPDHRAQGKVPPPLVPACWSLVSSLDLSAPGIAPHQLRAPSLRQKNQPLHAAAGLPRAARRLYSACIFVDIYKRVVHCTRAQRLSLHMVLRASLAWLSATFCKLLPLAVVFGGRASSCNVRIEPAACHSQGIISTL
jgi:hypothetical protein